MLLANEAISSYLSIKKKNWVEDKTSLRVKSRAVTKRKAIKGSLCPQGSANCKKGDF